MADCMQDKLLSVDLEGREGSRHNIISLKACFVTAWKEMNGKRNQDITSNAFYLRYNMLIHKRLFFLLLY